MSPDKTSSPGESDRATSEFLLRACHDLRNSIRSIRAPAELILKEQETQASELGARLGFIIDGARAIDLLVEGLVSYSLALQIERDALHLTPMNVLLRNALARMEKELSSSGAEVTYTDLPRIPGDPDRLIQLWQNLIGNALRHRDNNPPKVHITAERSAEEWLFAVRDNGPGIEAVYLETIFQPFERLRDKKCPGLGLTVCRKIVERHGGRIWAESQAGCGSTFFFTLPAD